MTPPNLPFSPGVLAAVLLGASLGAWPLAAAGTSWRPAAEAPGHCAVDGRDGLVLKGLVLGDEKSVVLTGCKNVRIESCDLRSVSLYHCEGVVVANCHIHDSGPPAGVVAGGCRKVEVRGCLLERVASGVYATDSTGLSVVGNCGRNMMGPFPRGQLAQFDNVTGPGNEVRENYCVNEFGRSHHEDAINIYQSEGTAASPIRVERNYIVGDPVRGSEGKSPTGSGIMLADCGGRNIVCRGNVVLSGGQVGMGVAGGSAITVEDNLIVGRRSDVSNCGLYVWNQSKKPGGGIRVVGNRVFWITKAGVHNDWWNGGGFADVEVKDNHFGDASIPQSVPPPPPAAALLTAWDPKP